MSYDPLSPTRECRWALSCADLVQVSIAVGRSMSVMTVSYLEDSVSQNSSPSSSSYILSTSSLGPENGDTDVPFSAKYSVP